jgi:cytochrome b561/polyisoprenoid-binding protein YceI
VLRILFSIKGDIYMRLSNSEESYGVIHQLLHWITAVLILVLLPMGVYMHDLPIDTSPQINDKVWLYSLHKTIGMTALAVALIRIAWAIIQPHPRPLHGGMEGFAAKTVHFLLYGTIIAMPILGWLHHAAAEGFAPIWWPLSQDLAFIPKDVALSNFFKTAHFVCGVLLVLSLGLHIAGALKHVFIDKDKTLSRMVPGAYQETGDIPQQKVKSTSPLLVALAACAIAMMSTLVVYNMEYAQPVETVAKVTQAQEVAPIATSTGAWVINTENSTLEIEVTQLGTPIIGRFGTWSADVIFDPENLEAATIKAEVDVSSLTLGEVSERAISPEFLDTPAHPTAIFTSSSVEQLGNNYIAKGTLNLAGVEQDFDINFTFDDMDGVANVTGNAVLQRLEFGVGKTFIDDSSVGRSINLMIKIQAKRP